MNRRWRRTLLWVCGGVGVTVAAVLFGMTACVVSMPGARFHGPLAPLTDTERVLETRLRQHVDVLAGEIGERNRAHPAALLAAEKYIHSAWESQGWAVTRESFDCQGMEVSNVIVEIPGKEHPEEIVLIGAHYDSALGTPGADDNASGTAALIELGASLRDHRPRRTIRLVAFVNEEMPWFGSDLQGAQVHAQSARRRGDAIVAMFSLETMGYFSEEPKSQQYPAPFSWFYPSTGHFVGFVGNMKSRRLVRRSVRLFREQQRMPSEGVAAPGSIDGVGWSDHAAFWDEDYPAVMVTDTAPFRNPHYHRATDTPDQLDFQRLARLVEGLESVFLSLANE